MADLPTLQVAHDKHFLFWTIDGFRHVLGVLVLPSNTTWRPTAESALSNMQGVRSPNHVHVSPLHDQ